MLGTLARRPSDPAHRVRDEQGSPAWLTDDSRHAA